ncbi:hypothetical protein HMPREF0556_11523 [Listeria grayi DSM 20601]|uniref:Uncharacterized protein n=1 Tax=Listeria grayi DSM 20601 TaxID=525367 RepID=D7UZJ3_LISGR|nr:hypothetical protein HMPREF0556_11523 [Listeria grayi DSM 20601]
MKKDRCGSFLFSFQTVSIDLFSKFFYGKNGWDLGSDIGTFDFFGIDVIGDIDI